MKTRRPANGSDSVAQMVHVVCGTKSVSVDAAYPNSFVIACDHCCTKHHFSYDKIAEIGTMFAVDVEVWSYELTSVKMAC
jgi:hypothetical protein